MRCPAGDKELTHHTRTNHAGVTISFFHCDGCDGYWTSGFDANYIDRIDEPSSSTRHTPLPDQLLCPKCQNELEILRSDVVPLDITIYTCHESHGYFFPRGELAKFKQAQDAKISYHKLWHIPLPPLHSVLLATLILFLGISGIAIVTQIQRTQQIQSQAHDLLAYQETIVSPADGSILFLARTSSKTTLTLHLETLRIIKPLTTSDGLSHTLLITERRWGTYSYYYEFITNGKKIRSQTYKLTLP